MTRATTIAKTLPRITRASYLSIAPTDVVVLEIPGHVSEELAARLKAELKRLWPQNRVLVLSDGMKLAIGIAQPDGNGSNGDQPPADQGDEMSAGLLLKLLTKAGADVCLADFLKWTPEQCIEARTWALQQIDATANDVPGKHTSVKWPDHVSLAHHGPELRKQRPKPRGRRA